ncbi:MAG: HlyD family type I secretion periplasmic adaptor subunit [Rubrivivax sp.]|nr:HlyD family type I secretion periplasmic adaptor subunit [Rubrivivax sp.]
MTSAQLTPRHPRRELIARYRAVLAAAWAAREELAGPKRLTDEAAFLPPALALQETPVHPAPRRAMWAIIALVVVTILWAYFGKLDVVVVAPGRIVVSDGTKVIQPLEASIVKAIHVRDGMRVTAGQVLIELDPTAAAADMQSLGAQVAAARAETARTADLLRALGAVTSARAAGPTASPPVADLQTQTEWADIQSRLERLDAEITRREAEGHTARTLLAKLQSTAPLVAQREADMAALAKQGFVSSHVGQDRARERIEMEQDLETQRARVAEAQAALSESLRSRASYLAELRRVLVDRANKARLELGQLEPQGRKAAQRQQVAQLKAPVSGTVQQLVVRTLGGVVTPAQALMVVVPDEAELTAEVFIENKDIADVRVGQAVDVKVDAFDFTRYGTVPAVVLSLSEDSVVDEKLGARYVAILMFRTGGSMHAGGSNRRIGPGMSVIAEMHAGQRRILEYILSPMIRRGMTSLRER